MEKRSDLKDFSFVSAQCPAYPTRKARFWSYVGGLTAFVLACFLFSINWGPVGAVTLSMAIAWFFGTIMSTSELKFYITRYELKEGQLTIEYTEKGEPRTLCGHGSEFVAQKKRNPHRSRGRSPCFVIYRDGKVLLEQCMIGDWNESACDSVVQSMGGKIPSNSRLWFY